MKNVQLLIIDPQNDFIDIPLEIRKNMSGNSQAPFESGLPVTGSWEDSLKLAQFIKQAQKAITGITVTLDTHQQYDVAHEMFWINETGQHPAPFTIITSEEIRNGKWKPIDNSVTQRMIDYAEALEKQGLFPLCIWPYHCIVGTQGYGVVQPVMESLLEWERTMKTRYAPVTKGHNPYTEHYGAFFAEVVDPKDPTTTLNNRLIKRFKEADLILLTGQALSHCVNRTVTQLADNFGEENIKKLVLLEDTSSSVTGFEQAGLDFIKDMKARGMRCVNTTDIKIVNNEIILP
jgi:nicotinamidase-related amidase